MTESKRIYFTVKPQKKLSLDNARAAIISWMYGKQNQAELFFGIQDIFSNPSSEHNITRLIDNLKWLGIDWRKIDEWGGSEGELRQLQRLFIYQEMAWDLVRSGKAYLCYCKSNSNIKRSNENSTAGFDWECSGECRQVFYNKDNAIEKQGQIPKICLRVDAASFEIEDLVQGKIEFTKTELKDFVILREDNRPSPNFAIAADIYSLDISHCFQNYNQFRDSLQQALLLEALGAADVEFGHISNIKPMPYVNLQNHEQKQSIDHYREQGFLGEALFQMLATLDLDDDFKRRCCSADELIAQFSFDRQVNTLPEIDHDLLKQINFELMNEYKLGQLVELAIPFLKNMGIPLSDMGKIRKIVDLLRKRKNNLLELVNEAELFFLSDVIIQDNQLKGIIKKDSSQKIFWSFLRELKYIDILTVDAFSKIMQSIQKETGIMGRDLWLPIRIALTGKVMDCELPTCAEILGKESCKKFVMAVVHNFL